MRLDIHNSEVPLLCRSCEARHRGVCGALDASQLVRLSRHTLRREVPPGTVLVAAGEPAERCVNVLSGVVKLIRMLPDGRQQIVGLQFVPDFIGRPFAASSEVSAEAAGPVRLCSFPRAALEAMMREAPDLQHRLHAQALRELDEAREWMMTLGRKTAAERVAFFLLLVARHVDPEGPGVAASFELPLSRSDIADFLGLTVETVTARSPSSGRSGRSGWTGDRWSCSTPRRSRRRRAADRPYPASRRTGLSTSRSCATCRLSPVKRLRSM